MNQALPITLRTEFFALNCAGEDRNNRTELQRTGPDARIYGAFACF